MENKQIADIFEEMANILEIKGEDFFRVNAYRKASLNIREMSADLKDLVRKDPKHLHDLPGIGKTLEDKIVELVQTGKLRAYEKLREGFPAGLLEMLKLRGIGPKKVKMFYSVLNIQTMAQLKKAAEDGVIAGLKGMGEKSEREILEAMQERESFSDDRILISVAKREAVQIIEYMKKMSGIDQISYAGSLRRIKESIGDIDILVTAKDHAEVMAHFLKYPGVNKVVNEGPTKSTVFLEIGVDCDLRVVDDESFGAALHYFTGSKAHNIRIRDIAKKKGLKVNEYGVFDGERKVGGVSEEEIFAAVGLPFMPPELREDNGEIEYGLKHEKFPKLIELGDLKGDLHTHTSYSDGKNSIEEMARAYIAAGMKYFAVCDHSPIVAVAGSMSRSDIERQWKEIDEVQGKLGKKIKILKGVEVDILKDGSLDFEEEVLKELDMVVISAHFFRDLDSEQQTKRLIAAIENPYAKILGHPTARLINKRGPMNFEMEKIIEACVQNKVLIEINSSPDRLDLPFKYIKMAKEKGALFSINGDSHRVSDLENLEFGVGIAKKGWLEKKDCVNTFNLKDLTLKLK
ncbi:DNA polymerase/3'-5' exonuclease PolX [Patescibacteria group bacterium]|nr:DNA polymerase/3'-5' exonuclease PolX [Patescibacteria group bacterium]